MPCAGINAAHRGRRAVSISSRWRKIMTHQTNLQATKAPIGWAIGQVVDRAKQLGALLFEVSDAYADSCATAALYQELSRLSDAELERRGIPRSELHRFVFETMSSSATNGDPGSDRIHV